ncbi:MAG: hypothetical protein HRT35_35485 [Algicola sp.]|nr:hypothetical protein [Algicola sp.]
MPFLLFIQLKQRLRWTVNAAVELVAFVGLMFFGINLVNLLLNQLFPGFTIEPLQRAASAILCGIFIYTIYRLWLMQQNLLQEQLLRKEARFDQDLNVNFEVNPNTVALKIPPLLLQPLVENCIKHAKVLP